MIWLCPNRWAHSRPARSSRSSARSALIDGGLILERRATPGLIYRTRDEIEATAEAQVALAVTGPADGIRPGLGFDWSDERYRNEWEVTARNGGSATAVDEAAQAEADVVDDAVEVNGVGGVNLGYLQFTRPELVPHQTGQLARIAQRLLAASTVADPRVRDLAVELSIVPALLDDWHRFAVGDRVTLDGLPVQWTAGLVDLVAEGYAETLTADEWLLELTCAPRATWIAPEPPAQPQPIVLFDFLVFPFAIPNDFRTVWDIPLPPTIPAGATIEILLGQQESGDPGFPTTVPAGFLTRYELPAVFTSQIPRLGKYYKRGVDVTGAEGGTTVQFVYPNNTRLYGNVRVWTGVDGSTPYDIAAPTTQVTGASDPDPGAITTTTDGAVATTDLGGNRDSGTLDVTAFPTGYAPIAVPDPTQKGIMDAYRTVPVAGVEDPDAYAVVLNNSTVVTDALRPAGTPGSAPPAAKIPTGDLLIDVDPETPTTFNKNRASDAGQWIIAGDRFNPGLDGALHSLVYELDDTTILSHTMATADGGDGTDTRFRATTHNGVDVIEATTTYVKDGSYVNQSGAVNTAINVPPSDNLYFDGTRNQFAHIAKPRRVGPAGDVIRCAFAFVVEDWMQANDITTGPHELHDPGTGKTSPILTSIRSSQITFAGKYSSTPIDPDQVGNLPNDVTLGVRNLPPAGEFAVFIMEYKIDPDASGYCKVWELDSNGAPVLVIDHGSAFGWIYDEADPSYVDQNENFYAISCQQYNFHLISGSLGTETENWDDTGVAGTWTGRTSTPPAMASWFNTRRMRTAFFAMPNSTAVTINDLAGHARYHLGI